MKISEPTRVMRKINREKRKLYAYRLDHEAQFFYCFASLGLWLPVYLYLAVSSHFKATKCVARIFAYEIGLSLEGLV